MKTVLLCLSLACAAIASAQLIPGEPYWQQQERLQLQQQLDENRRHESANNARLQQQHEEQSGQLDELNRKLDEMRDNSDER